MRTVAVILALLTVVPMLPVAAADDCANAGAGSFCTHFTVDRPGSPPGVPTVPASPNYGKYYLWISGTRCTSPLSADCQGTSNPPVGVHVPEYGYAGVGLVAVLYQETNGAAGLQRFLLSRAPDRSVLA